MVFLNPFKFKFCLLFNLKSLNRQNSPMDLPFIQSAFTKLDFLMTSIFKWFVNAISTTTNSAAETLLSSIIKRFLEEPIQEDSLSLELFTDWTLHLTLKKSFLNVELVNSYVPFAKFKSIYFSNIQFDASYNLSNFVINLTRVVIEADVNKPETLPPIDENLTESIHVFQEQLPIEKDKSFKDWLFECVKKVNFTLDHFTIILSGSDDLEKISLNIESLSIFYETNAEIKMPKASILIGEKRLQRTIADIENLQFTYKQNSIEASIDSITILISESIISTIFSLVQIITQSYPLEKTQNNQNANINSEQNSLTAKLTLKKLKVNFSDELSIELNMTKIQYNINSILLNFESFTILNGNIKSLEIQSKLKSEPSFEYVFASPISELTIFKNFPNRLSEFSQFKNNNFNSNQINVLIPSLLFRISKPLISSVFDIIEWFTPLKSSKPSTTFSIKKSSYVVNLNLMNFATEFESLKFEISKPSISMYYSQTAANTFVNSFILFHSMSFLVEKNLSLLNFYYDKNYSKNCLSAVFSYRQQLGKDGEISVDFNLSDFLIRIPSRFDFIDNIKEIIDYIEYSDDVEIEEEEEDIENEKIAKNESSGQISSENKEKSEGENEDKINIENSDQTSSENIIKSEDENEGQINIESNDQINSVNEEQQKIESSDQISSENKNQAKLDSTEKVETITPNMSISFCVSFDRLHLDYVTLAMPSRLVVSLPSINVSGTLDTSPLQLSATATVCLNAYLTNHRDDLPLVIFSKPRFPCAEYNFAQICELKPTKISLFESNGSTHIQIDNLPCEVTFCFDSLKLFISFLMHVQYKLDNSPENQTKTKQFDLPQKLLDMTMTLNQSLRLDNFEFDPEKISQRGFMPSELEFIPQQFSDLQKLVASVRTGREQESEEEKSDNDFQFIGDFGDEVTVSSDEPVVSEKTVISVGHLSVVLKLFDGKDFDQIYDLRRIERMPVIGENEGEICSDFDIITTRDELNSINIEVEGNADVQMFNNDPSVSIRIDYGITKFSVVDCLQKSDCRIMLTIEDDDEDKSKKKNKIEPTSNDIDDFLNDTSEVMSNTVGDVKSSDRMIKGRIDILNTSSNRMEMNFKLSLPNLVMFINQEQINFFISLSQIRMPTFPSDLIVDEPPAFQLFEICPSDIQIAAHFRLWLDIHMDDIRLTVPKCQFFAVRGFDELIGNIAEFYVTEMSRPGAAAVIGGLPVIKNLRRIASAVHDLFTFDVQEFGVGVGLGKSFSALLQIIALETINMGANATSIAERFLYVTMKFLGRKDDAKEAIETGLATLVIERPENTKKAVRRIPTMILAPGVLTLKKLTEMMKSLRDKINPNYTKTHKYKKQKK